ncbi:hypothetical protein FGG08_004400 [Glutinoglossum americanum]|uniref:Uncharacterized protein n=1 Tax=Glutinoglossum americanum TaxID=1670608 RepID=A0A9P8L3Z7_9PEZI|nr:hypothetical protein FGG08_004400 [Glutinoglossum americanum]
MPPVSPVEDMEPGWTIVQKQATGNSAGEESAPGRHHGLEISWMKIAATEPSCGASGVGSSRTRGHEAKPMHDQVEPGAPAPEKPTLPQISNSRRRKTRPSKGDAILIGILEARDHLDTAQISGDDITYSYFETSESEEDDQSEYVGGGPSTRCVGKAIQAPPSEIVQPAVPVPLSEVLPIVAEEVQDVVPSSTALTARGGKGKDKVIIRSQKPVRQMVKELEDKAAVVEEPTLEPLPSTPPLSLWIPQPGTPHSPSPPPHSPTPLSPSFPLSPDAPQPYIDPYWKPWAYHGHCPPPHQRYNPATHSQEPPTPTPTLTAIFQQHQQEQQLQHHNYLANTTTPLMALLQSIEALETPTAKIEGLSQVKRGVERVLERYRSALECRGRGFSMEGEAT